MPSPSGCFCRRRLLLTMCAPCDILRSALGCACCLVARSVVSDTRGVGQLPLRDSAGKPLGSPGLRLLKPQSIDPSSFMASRARTCLIPNWWNALTAGHAKEVPDSEAAIYCSQKGKVSLIEAILVERFALWVFVAEEVYYVSEYSIPYSLTYQYIYYYISSRWPSNLFQSNYFKSIQSKFSYFLVIKRKYFLL